MKSLATLLLLVPCSAQNLSDRPEVVKGRVGRELDDYLMRCAAFGFSGCALVEVKGKLVLRKGYGVADPRSGARNTPETLYDIASASKQVTAAAILKLEALGKLSTDDPIAKYLPEVPEVDADVTIDHLLRHTSGYPRHGPSGGGPDLAQALRGYTSRGRTAEPGARFEYWNGGYALLAGIVERVSGEPFEDWVAAQLFAPAGLRHTDFIETARVEPSRLARTHDGGQALTTEYIKGWGYRGMGGVLTSVSDLHSWVKALLASNSILSEKARAEMLQPSQGDYACGWYVLETERQTRCVQHGGTSPGFETYIRYFIDEDTLTLVLCNREGMHWQVAWGLEALLYDHTPKVPWPPQVQPLEKRALANLLGTWEGRSGGQLELVADGTSLAVHAQGSEAIAALDGGAAASAADHAWEREHARRILEEIARGETATLEEVVQERIPRGWPTVVATITWPRHLERWGPLRGLRELGALRERAGVAVWLGLDHEHGERAVKIVFQDQRLGIFDLEAGRYPLSRHYAQVSRTRFESYAFSAEQRPALEWDSRQRTLSIGGLRFRRAE